MYTLFIRGLLAVHSAMFSEMFSSLENVEENGSFVVVLPDTNLEDLQNIFKVREGAKKNLIVAVMSVNGGGGGQPPVFN